MITIPDGIAPYLIQTQALDYQIRINRLTKRFYAGENIARGRAVYVNTDSKIYHVDISVPAKVDKFVGIAEEDGGPGSIITVCTHGLSQVGSSGWIAGVLYYIGSNGFLTSIEPVSGTIRKVGVGVDPDRILLTPSAGGSGGSGGSPAGEIGQLQYNAGSGFGAVWDKLFGDATFTYNLDGSIATKTVGTNTLEYSYNPDGSVDEITDSINVKTFSYNPDGSVNQIIYS